MLHVDSSLYQGVTSSIYLVSNGDRLGDYNILNRDRNSEGSTVVVTPRRS